MNVIFSAQIRFEMRERIEPPEQFVTHDEARHPERAERDRAIGLRFDARFSRVGFRLHDRRRTIESHLTRDGLHHRFVGDARAASPRRREQLVNERSLRRLIHRQRRDPERQQRIERMRRRRRERDAQAVRGAIPRPCWSRPDISVLALQT